MLKHINVWYTVFFSSLYTYSPGWEPDVAHRTVSRVNQLDCMGFYGCGGHLESGAVVLGADHGAQLLAVHCLVHLLEELLEGLLLIVGLELQPHGNRLSFRLR